MLRHYRKRLFLIAGAMAVCVGVTLAVLAMLPPRPGVTKANFDRIEIGMTRAQVEEILGPQDDYSAYTSFATFSMTSGFNRYCDWRSDDGARAQIQFHEDACLGCTVHTPAGVAQKTWYESEETILNKIRRWLGVPPVLAPGAPVPPPPPFPIVPPPLPAIPQ